MLSIGQQLQPLQAAVPKLTTEQQVAIIRKTMSKPSRSVTIPRYRFTFGKYAGKLLYTVVDIDKDYLMWCYHADTDLPVSVVKYIESEILTETTRTVQ